MVGSADGTHCHGWMRSCSLCGFVPALLRARLWWRLQPIHVIGSSAVFCDRGGVRVAGTRRVEIPHNSPLTPLYSRKTARTQCVEIPDDSPLTPLYSRKTANRGGNLISLFAEDREQRGEPDLSIRGRLRAQRVWRSPTTPP